MLTTFIRFLSGPHPESAEGGTLGEGGRVPGKKAAGEEGCDEGVKPFGDGSSRARVARRKHLPTGSRTNLTNDLAHPASYFRMRIPELCLLYSTSKSRIILSTLPKPCSLEIAIAHLPPRRARAQSASRRSVALGRRGRRRRC